MGPRSVQLQHTNYTFSVSGVILALGSLKQCENQVVPEGLSGDARVCSPVLAQLSYFKFNGKIFLATHSLARTKSFNGFYSNNPLAYQTYSFL